MFQVAPTTTLQIFLILKFIKNKLYAQFYYKKEQALLQSGGALIYYKAGQVLLQSGAALLYYSAGQVSLQCRADIT